MEPIDDAKKTFSGQGSQLMSYPGLEALDAECDALACTLDDLGSDDFQRPTNCPPWTLHELVIHIAWSIRMPDHFPLASADTPLSSAADYYRRPERNTEEYRTGNVERTRTAASKVAMGAAAEVFRESWQRATRIFGQHEPRQPITIRERPLTTESYLLTRLISIAAHGVDVAITLGREVWTTPAALRAVRPVLVDLLGDEPPASWSDQDLLEIGTGRRPLESSDRVGLGPRADRFPLLS